MKRAIVTGASRGIGRAVTEMLLAEGWHVTGVSRSDAGIAHDAFTGVHADVGDFAEVFYGLGDNLAPIDALVHCAGIRGPYGSFFEHQRAWDQTIQTNLMGSVHAIRTCWTRLHQSDDARILLFSGGGAFSPEPGYTAYAATKGATVALMETLAAELDGTSVSVNCVAPGFVATTIHQGTPHEGKPDAPEAMGNVVACVRHLLGPQARGLNGRTVSAQHDDWAHLSPWTLPHLDRMGTRDRHPIARLQATLIRQKHAI